MQFLLVNPRFILQISNSHYSMNTFTDNFIQFSSALKDADKLKMPDLPHENLYQMISDISALSIGVDPALGAGVEFESVEGISTEFPCST